MPFARPCNSRRKAKGTFFSISPLRSIFSLFFFFNSRLFPRIIDARRPFFYFPAYARLAIKYLTLPTQMHRQLHLPPLFFPLAISLTGREGERATRRDFRLTFPYPWAFICKEDAIPSKWQVARLYSKAPLRRLYIAAIICRLTKLRCRGGVAGDRSKFI